MIASQKHEHKHKFRQGGSSKFKAAFAIMRTTTHPSTSKEDLLLNRA